MTSPRRSALPALLVLTALIAGVVHARPDDDGATPPIFRQDGGMADGESGDGESAPAVEPVDAKGFDRRYGEIAPDDAEGYYQLGLRAEAGELTSYAMAAFRAAIRAWPDHAGAREKLGFVKYAGTWTTEQAMRAERGLELRDGVWVSIHTRKEREAAAAPKEEVAAAPARPVGDPDAWYDDHTTVCEFEKADPYKSKRYIIKSNIKPEYVKRYGVMLDQYYERFKSVFRGVALPGTKYTASQILIYADQEAFMKANRMPRSVGGFYRPKDRLVVAYHGRFGKTGTTRLVLAHEGTHQFQHLVLADGFMNCPVWLIEGLAVLFESADYNPKLKKVELGTIPRDRMEIMKKLVEQGKTFKLEALFSTPQSNFSGTHYAHAWSVLYMLIYGTKNKASRARNGKILSDLFTMGRKRRVRPRDAVTAFGGKAKLEAFEEEWKDWIKKTDYDFRPK